MTVSPTVRGSSVLVRNTALNFAGLAAPLVAGIVSLPLLLESLGRERFGIQSLAYVLIGYLGLFDIGLGRALTQLLARRRGAGTLEDVGPLVWTYMWFVTMVGIIGGLALAVASPWLVRDVLKMSAGLQNEAIASFVLIGAALPLSLTTPGLRGCLEAFQRFDLVAWVRVPSGLALVLAPLAVLPFTTDLTWVMAVVVAVRAATWVAHFLQCRWLVPAIKQPRKFSPQLLRPMLGFAGWLSVSNVLAPLMAYFDRFLIGSLLSVSTVALYATPYDVVTKLTILPLALTGVLFPAFATNAAAQDADAAPLFWSSMRFTLMVMFPVTAVVVAVAHPAMSVWIDPSFADAAAPVLRVLAIGVLLNGLAQVPLGLLQGIGRPKQTSLLLLAELPFYLAGLWVGVLNDGIVGAALVWTARVAVDALVLTVMAERRLDPGRVDRRGRPVFAAVLTCLIVLGVLAAPRLPLALDLAALPLTLVAFLGLAWGRLLTAADRAAVLGLRGRAG
ncbi:MAG: O13/O129/O135 family O-antigen flippase [Candidatus Dormibacteria bacterium]